MGEKSLISVVVPVFNEEAAIVPFLDRMSQTFSKMSYDYEVIFCMDPSTDQICRVILEQREKNPRIKLFKMSRKFGQPAATFAGIANCKGEACIIIDVDLQDPPEIFPEMLEKWKEGYEVVYAQRSDRDGEKLFKKVISSFGYWLINKVGEVKIPEETGDFRLLGRKAIDQIRSMKDHDCFLRGMVGFVGFRQTSVSYHRDARITGEGKYNPFTGSLWIGLNGLFGYSRAPLHGIVMIGSFFAALSGFIIFLLLLACLFWGSPGAGWWIFALIMLVGGVQIGAVGIVGQYIARTFNEIKRRPIYIVDEAYGIEKVVDGNL